MTTQQVLLANLSAYSESFSFDLDMDFSCASINAHSDLLGLTY